MLSFAVLKLSKRKKKLILFAALKTLFHKYNLKSYSIWAPIQSTVATHCTVLNSCVKPNNNQIVILITIVSGEANVYTLGDVGSHRVVTTKLPMTGSTRDALIATGSTTTRLLGTFQVKGSFIIAV